MGEQKVSLVSDRQQMQKFVKSLLADVDALDYMLKNDWFEKDVVRIGAEQEMVMVYKKTYKPACVAMEALDKLAEHPWVETELAKFNLETNINPQLFEGKCFSALEKENAFKLEVIQKSLDELDAYLVLTGILPTLRKHHLEMGNLTPKKRYKALMEAIDRQLLGTAYELRITGIDELLLKHSSPLLEAVNTSFQVHLQVSPDNFVQMYNIAQALAAPVMAIAANSPIVFGKRLWHESRIAMFQQSIDTRTTHDHMRERSPRVSYGKDWIHESILDIYKEDIARFRVLLSSDIEEDSLNMIKNKQVPKLRALQVHNSTVYRWNRPCYGISENGKPHMRIENRVLPSGPTVVDEVANACFWLGLMVGMGNAVPDMRKKMQFVDTRDNFLKAARFGIDTKFTWWNDKKISAVDLLTKELLPIAREGLMSRNIDTEDMDKYLNIIEERATSHMTGARWLLRAYTDFSDKTTTDEALTALTSCMIVNQQANKPIHTWEMPQLQDFKSYSPYALKVSDFMVTDIFTVQKDDIIDLVAEMMSWRKIRHTPVEDSKGNLVGLISSRHLIHYLIKNKRSKKTATVEDIMIQSPVTITEEATIMDAMKLMRENKIGCLPVTKGKELVGIITEMDFLRVTGRLLESMG
ncbi:MAG TPA: glutamate-cysteine ligase family protein [Saprospiraceae bacterium]|nr:glutamate-cysteine ligase family protein [Saprospiraceae bacterium]